MIALAILLTILSCNNALVQNHFWKTKPRSMMKELGASTEDSSLPTTTKDDDKDQKLMRMKLKSELFGLSAACDRGFGASPTDRKKISHIIDELSFLSPEVEPTRNLYPYRETNTSSTGVPLAGVWKMVYTSALDVLLLAANPFSLIQGIYQVIEMDGATMNVIDLAPRLQVLLPQAIVGEGSTLRLKVGIRAAARSNTRVGLSFRDVQIQPLSLFGMPLPSSLQSPKAILPQAALFGVDFSKDTPEAVEGPGFFDIAYLDEDCLIIKQNEPGGVFVSIRSDTDFPEDFFE